MTPSLTRRAHLTRMVGLTGVLAAACTTANLIGPENSLEVANFTDSFQWQVTALDNVSQSLSYNWQTTGTIADINQAPGLSGGSAALRITDADGAQVYAQSLDENGTFSTSAGVSGTWTIEVVLSGAHGALNFRVQKP